MSIQEKFKTLKQLYSKNISDFVNGHDESICFIGQDFERLESIQSHLSEKSINQLSSFPEDHYDLFIIDCPVHSRFIKYAQEAKQHGARVFLTMRNYNDKTIQRLKAIGVDGFIENDGTISEFCKGDMKSRLAALDQSMAQMKLSSN